MQVDPQVSEDNDATNAARILKALASKHEAANPIPIEIEQATDRWMWIKLQQDKEHKAFLHTGGRVSDVHK